MILLQEHINELQMKVNILQEANKNFALFLKHFHKMTQNKSQLEDLLNKHEKYQKRPHDQNESIKYQQQFYNIYQRSYIHLRTIEQQRLLAIREQMRFAMNLTMATTDDHNLFSSNNFDDLLNTWDQQHIISIDHWSHFPRRSNISQHEISLLLLDEIKQITDEYYNHRQNIIQNKNPTLTRITNQLKLIDNSNDAFVKCIDSNTSNLTQSYI
ncbi:unnamed protein product [Adineta steineri]|nr:unnamed protein product [Adineta steineri]